MMKEGASTKPKRRLFALTCSLLMLLLLPANAYAAGVPDAASGKVILPEDGTTTYVNELPEDDSVVDTAEVTVTNLY